MSSKASNDQPLLFIYGSLLVTEVMSALIERVPICQPGEVQGYNRYQLTERPYPGLFKGGPAEVTNEAIQGLLVCGLSADEMAILDYFEGDEYVTGMVQVKVCRTAHSVSEQGYLPQTVDAVKESEVEAVAYLFNEKLQHRLFGKWRPEDFLRMDIVPSYAANAKSYGEEARKLLKEGAFKPRGLGESLI